MSPLRRRLIEDMQIRNLAPSTQRAYVAQLVHFAYYFRKSPDLLGPAEIRAYSGVSNARKGPVILPGGNASWPSPWPSGGRPPTAWACSSSPPSIGSRPSAARASFGVMIPDLTKATDLPLPALRAYWTPGVETRRVTSRPLSMRW
jgi:hypothetical protein